MTPIDPKIDGNKIVTLAFLLRVVKMITQDVRDLVAVPMRSRIDGLEERLAQLEARPEMKYEGIWRSDRESKAGTFLTDRGSLWYCRKNTLSRPAEGDAWQLVAKRGADGRDAPISPVYMR